MVDLAETHGPDRCRSNINCRDFHDPPVEITGERMNCCCCNTCLSVRPGIRGDKVDFRHCCRCLPRLMYLQFTPNDSEEDCCNSSSVPMVYGGTDEDEVSTYSGSLHGVGVTVTCGASDAVYDEYERTCVWRVVAVQGGTTIADDEYEIDHDVISCLDVSAIDIVEAEGPNDCTGVYSLANMATGRLPFTEAIDDTYDKIIDIYPPAGECEQVCGKLCVYGNRMLGEVREYVEFVWFDNGVDDRGWWYEGDNGVEKILLQEVYGECVLHFDWTGSSVLDDCVVDMDRGLLMRNQGSCNVPHCHGDNWLHDQMWSMLLLGFLLRHVPLRACVSVRHGLRGRRLL